MMSLALQSNFVTPVDVSKILLEMKRGVLVFDHDGSAVFANIQARMLLGSIEPIGDNFLNVIDRAGKLGHLAPASASRLADWFKESAPSPCTCQTPAGESLLFSFQCGSDGERIVLFDDVTQILQASEVSFRDPLTGIANRAEFRLRLEEAVARYSRTGESAAVLCIDLDRFKTVNDTLGHPMGDALLKSVTDRIRSALRAEDVVARLGGDEFAVLLPSTASPRAAEALAARLVDLIGRTYVLKGHMLNIGASIGISVLPADGMEADELIKNADLALYRAKSDGRGVYRFFESEMDAKMQARRSLEVDLRNALALREFSLAFQPQVFADDGDVKGFEALIRWEHPTRGQVSPADFIPLAEEIGLIQAIGEWVLRTACMEAASWRKPVVIAVNVSAVQFRGGQLVKTVVNALKASGLDPTRLEIEITESVIIGDTDAVLQALRQLRDLGVRISMDDFGTGYSSLSYLQKFPFTKIKIDQSFVRQMETDPDCAAIVRAVAALGASLGMRTTAEGVETKEQLDLVRREGCTEIQGYLTGRPMTAQCAAALLNGPPANTDLKS